jgi:hypothetical protein
MVYTLERAAKVTGVSKQKILADLKSGKLSGTQDEQRRWQIEPTELNRAYRHLKNSNATQVDGADAAADETQKPAPNAYLLALQAEKKGLEKHLELVTNERDDLRRRLDDEVEDRRRLITLVVDQRKRSWLQRIGLRR